MIATIICTPARKLMAAALALTGCRVLSEWDSIFAGSVALVVLFVLVASLIAGMPRLRRMSILVALPVATVANSVVFALGAFIVLLGAKGYLPNGSIGGRGPLWNWNFTVVPLVAATNFVALAWPSLAARWRRGIWLANMASAAYAIRFWDVEDDYSRMLGIPMSFESILLIALAVLSLAVGGSLAGSDHLGRARGAVSARRTATQMEGSVRMLNSRFALALAMARLR